MQSFIDRLEKWTDNDGIQMIHIMPHSWVPADRAYFQLKAMRDQRKKIPSYMVTPLVKEEIAEEEPPPKNPLQEAKKAKAARAKELAEKIDAAQAIVSKYLRMLNDENAKIERWQAQINKTQNTVRQMSLRLQEAREAREEAMYLQAQEFPVTDKSPPRFGARRPPPPDLAKDLSGVHMTDLSEDEMERLGTVLNQKVIELAVLRTQKVEQKAQERQERKAARRKQADEAFNKKTKKLAEDLKGEKIDVETDTFQCVPDFDLARDIKSEEEETPPEVRTVTDVVAADELRSGLQSPAGAGAASSTATAAPVVPPLSLPAVPTAEPPPPPKPAEASSGEL